MKSKGPVVAPHRQDSTSSSSSKPAHYHDEETPLLADTGCKSESEIGTQIHESWRGKPSVSLLIPPFLLYCIAIGAINVPKLNIILNLICLQYHDNKNCQLPAVHAQLGRFMLYANVISGVLCIFSSPRLGALSDRYGRKRILALTSSGMLLGDAITILVALFPTKLSVYWILLEFALGGLAGSFVATMSIVQAYAADCTESEKRGVVFSRLHACVYLGTALGPAAGSLCVRAFSGDLLAVFYAAGVCHLTFFCFVFFILPESRKGDKSTEIKCSWHVLHILRPLAILRPPLNEASRQIRANMTLLAAIDTVVFGITLGTASLQVMYPEYRFNWSTFETGLLISLTNTIRATILTLIMPLAFRLLRSSGRTESFYINSIRISVLFDVVGYIGLAASSTPVLFTLSSALATVGAIASPASQSLLTTHVSPARTGELLGAISLLHALARLTIPAILHLIYSLTVGGVSTAIFWTLALTFLMAFAASTRLRPHVRADIVSVV